MTRKQAIAAEMNSILAQLGRAEISEPRIRKMGIPVIEAQLEALKAELPAPAPAIEFEAGSNEATPYPAPAAQTDDGPVAAEGSEAADDASLTEMLALASEEAPDLTKLGEEGANGRCPHCGIDHRANGYTSHEAEVQDGRPGCDTNEFRCLGCGGEWGPEVTESFAMKFAKAGGNEPRGICKALRAVAADWKGSRKTFLEGAKEANLNVANAAAEWQAGRKR